MIITGQRQKLLEAPGQMQMTNYGSAMVEGSVLAVVLRHRKVTNLSRPR